MFAALFLSKGRLRPVWRAVLFYAITLVFLLVLLPLVETPLFKALHIGDELSAPAVGLDEFLIFVFVLAVTGIFARFEHRRVDSYFLPVGLALGRNTWEGFAVGIVMAGSVAVGMVALGGMQIHGFSMSGVPLLLSALAWLGANVCVGVGEELWFRAYGLETLWKGIGFWPASIAIALFFAALHYFFKAGENIWDVITLVSTSMLLAYSVLRTGTLWFAVGFHVAFDFMQFFVIGTPNGTQVPVGRLLDVTFHGPAWLTGGVLGTEASFLMYPAIALLWLYVWWRWRPNVFRPEPES